MAERAELIVRAAVFSTDDGFDGHTAAVAEQADGSGFALHFLREHGAPGYVITTNEGTIVDGGVERWSVGERHLDLDLEAPAAQQLLVPERFRLLLRADRRSNEGFLSGIRHILSPARDEEESA